MWLTERFVYFIHLADHKLQNLEVFRLNFHYGCVGFQWKINCWADTKRFLEQDLVTGLKHHHTSSPLRRNIIKVNREFTLKQVVVRNHIWLFAVSAKQPIPLKVGGSWPSLRTKVPESRAKARNLAYKTVQKLESGGKMISQIDHNNSAEKETWKL